MCNLVIYDAIRSEASDVHIEPALHDMQVRMRVDGVLRDYTRVPKWLHGPVVSRLKILAKLDIAERRLPQAGRVNVQYQGRSIDLLRLLELLNGLLGTNVQPQLAPPRPGDVRESMADITRARTCLGYEPLVDFDEGLRRSIQYYRSLIEK